MLRKLVYPVTFLWIVITDIFSGIYYLIKNGYPIIITIGCFSLVIYLIACAVTQSWAPGYPELRWYSLVFFYSWIPCLILGIFFLLAYYRHQIIKAISSWFEGTKLRTEEILGENPKTFTEVPPNQRPKPKPPQQQRGRFE